MDNNALRSGDMTAFSCGPVVLIEWGLAPGWPVLSLSSNFTGLLPLQAEQLEAGVDYINLVCPEDRAELVKQTRAAIERRDADWDHLYRISDGQGGYCWVMDHTRATYDTEGRLVRLHGYLFQHDGIAEQMRREQALAESEARWRAVLLATSQGVWDWNAQTNRVYFSPLWKSMLGYGEDEVGDTLDEWDSRLHPDDRERVYRDLNQHLEGRTPAYENIHRMRARDGSWRWILDKGQVFSRDAQGRPLRVIGTHTDVTEQYIATSRLTLLASNVPGALYQYHLRADGSSAFPYATAGIESVYEVTPEQVRNDAAPVFDRLHPDDQERVAHTIQVSANTLTDWREEYRVILPERGIRWLRGQATPRRDGDGGVLWHGYLVDITDEAYLQLGYEPGAFDVDLDVFQTLVHPDDWDMMLDAVQRQMARGEGFMVQFRLLHADGHWIWMEGRGKTTAHDAEGQPTFMMGTHTNIDASKQTEAALQAARQAADEANQAKSRFLANMSHEIRTPMSAIIGLSDLGRHETDPHKLREQLHKVHASAGQLLGILNDILDLSKIEAGQFELSPRPYQMSVLVDNLLSLFGDSARDKYIALSAEVEPVVSGAYTGDELRLKQVLSNLLNNAIKFTDAGQVRLKISAAPMPAGQADDGRRWVRFSVSDTGPGIDPETRSKLFRPFVQGDASATRQHGGTGLGLTISERLVDMLGGDGIHLETAPGQGSRFSFVIPLRNSSAAELARLAEDNSSPLAKDVRFDGHVLLAEDNPINQEVARAQLQQLGVTLVVVDNGQRAVEAVATQHFDLVLMDIQMPVMDGFEAARRIVQQHPDLPVVALTAAVMPEDRDRAAEAGMCAHLGKPFDRTALAEVLAQWLPELSSRTAVRAEVADTPALPLLDEDWALQQLGGNIELYHSLLSTLREDLQQRYCRLAERAPAALDSVEQAHWRREAHSLKGSAANLGVKRMADAAARFEKALDSGNMFEAAQRHFAVVLSDTLRALAAAIPETVLVSACPDQAVPAEGARDLLELRERLRHNEFIDDIERQRCARLVPEHGRRHWHCLEQALDALDFEGACRALEQLLSELGGEQNR
ncbi:PAS domain-containing hybrid sensor histidine kinase/response regulator [Marinobacterium weihaiense]|uniref:histidine kinase n=1 Tax=Marinobacterium weihaiense TaxID=2851016 RepID=A0ABS6MBD5_9GAMM|nr:PAS domain-containing hybrid sensor histidine kinase/response regulator [Marinobacterium weihaiense]MBV0933612.1 PAS domain-containing protein [Marinobacterium weihaiense]